MKIVFIGPDDSARAPMAAAMAKKLLPPNYEISSVGLAHGTVNSHAVEVMSEIDIDISNHESRHADGEHLEGARYIVFVSLNKGKIQTGRAHQIVWPIPDPANPPGNKEAVLERFRDTRTALEKHIIALAKIVKS